MATTMRRAGSAFGSGALGILGLLSGSCGTVICPGGMYAPGPEGCPKETDVIQASFPIARKDLRDDPAGGLTITLLARSADLKTTYKLVQVPQVDLTLDGMTQNNVPSAIGMDEGSVIVSRSPDLLDVGLLSARVTLPGLDPVETDKPLRVFRSPQFGAPESVEEVFNQRHAIPIRARVSVQIVNPTGGSGRVLVSEETQCPSWWKDMTKCGTAPFYRWLDLYSPASSGTDSLVYASDSTWQATYGAMQTSTSALLAYAKGAVIRYDTTRAPNPLSIWPQAGVMQDSFNSDVPKNATALAACGEESALLLAQPGEVRGFSFDNSANVVLLGSVMTSGSRSAVIAARDVQGKKPNQRSVDYFAVVFASDGKATLLKLSQPAMGPSTGIMTGRDVSEVVSGEVGAAALGDLDSDGLQDLVMVRTADSALLWSPQLKDGSFAPAAPLTSLDVTVQPMPMQRPTKVEGAVSISIGDLNNDDLPDLAITTIDRHLYIYRNQARSAQ